MFVANCAVANRVYRTTFVSICDPAHAVLACSYTSYLFGIRLGVPYEMTLTDSPADTTADQRPPYPTGLLIGGRVVDGRAEPIPVINPATGKLITEVAGASADDVDDAVRTANETFRNGDWATMPIHDRARPIHRFP